MEQGKTASVKRKNLPLGWWTVTAAALAILVIWVAVDRPALAERGDFDGVSPIQVYRTQTAMDSAAGRLGLLNESRDFYPGQEGYDELRDLLEETRCALSPKAMADSVSGVVEDLSGTYTVILPSGRYVHVVCGADGWVQMDRYWIYGRAGEQFRETMDRLVPVDEET